MSLAARRRLSVGCDDARGARISRAYALLATLLGREWVSRPELDAALGCSKRTSLRNISEAERVGLIEVHRGRRGDDATLSEDLVANHNCLRASTGIESPSIYSRALFALATAEANRCCNEMAADGVTVCDVLRRELETVEARHEADETYYDLQRERDSLKEREAMWRELDSYWITQPRRHQLRRALGLEG